MINAIIIDDEPLAIEALQIILERHCKTEVRVVATSTSALNGKELIELHQPEVVFLDVEMPELSGIDLVRSFDNPIFRVVFVTAFDAYAIEAFRLSAIDYLLKPVEVEEIIRVVKKLKSDIAKSENNVHVQMEKLEQLIINQHSPSATRIGIAMVDKITFVNIDDILYCEAEGVYTSVYLIGGKKIVASKPLGDFEIQLPSSRFFRIHHSTLINLHHIKEFQRFDGGYVIMQNDVRLKVSHRKKKEFLEAIDNLVV